MPRFHDDRRGCALRRRAGAALSGVAGLRQAGGRAAPALAVTGGAATPGSTQDFVVNVGDRVFFETDSTELTPRGARRRSTSQVAVAAAAIRATRSSSRAMPTSAARANTTSRSAPAAPPPSSDYLVSRGIAANRMRTISYGKERPVAVCNDISCWSQNRRAVTSSLTRRRRLIAFDSGIVRAAAFGRRCRVAPNFGRTTLSLCLATAQAAAVRPPVPPARTWDCGKDCRCACGERGLTRAAVLAAGLGDRTGCGSREASGLAAARPSRAGGRSSARPRRASTAQRRRISRAPHAATSSGQMRDAEHQLEELHVPAADRCRPTEPSARFSELEPARVARTADCRRRAATRSSASGIHASAGTSRLRRRSRSPAPAALLTPAAARHAAAAPSARCRCRRRPDRTNSRSILRRWPRHAGGRDASRWRLPTRRRRWPAPIGDPATDYERA